MNGPIARTVLAVGVIWGTAGLITIACDLLDRIRKALR